ncbi:hypothetical protein ACFQ8T_14665 [Isoptericola sp. NPDC056618]|uniref:hypothetical protein n=1 Tax=Isoptericola sp. NPDC056618 TaxID=3345878 RepID=UPI0036AEEB2A
MTPDEQFARELRAHVDDVAPRIDVRTDGVVPAARRRRARRALVSGVASVAVVAVAAAWWVEANPWFAAEVSPAGPDVPVVVRETPERPEPSTEPGAELGGWPDDPYWLVTSETAEAGDPDSVATRQTWYGHTDPGLWVTDGDLERPDAFGQAIWGVLLIDGEWVQIHWDELYSLPTDAAALDELLRGSVEDDRGVGTPDDKIFEMAKDLLAASPAPPEVRDALWAVMSGLPGTSVEVEKEDSLGRTGERLEHEATEGGTVRLAYDTDEHRLLEVEELGIDGQALWRSTYLEEGPADDTPVEPTLEMAGCARWENC